MTFRGGQFVSDLAENRSEAASDLSENRSETKVGDIRPGRHEELFTHISTDPLVQEAVPWQQETGSSQKIEELFDQALRDMHAP